MELIGTRTAGALRNPSCAAPTPSPGFCFQIANHSVEHRLKDPPQGDGPKKGDDTGDPRGMAHFGDAGARREFERNLHAE